MNKVRKFLPGFALGLIIAMAGIAAAQNRAPANAGSKNDSCCCASSGCCGDSCDMKQKDAMKNHVTSSVKDDCCACCGDSCDMKQKDATKNHVTPADKHECCCGGDSCDMKNMKDIKKS